MRGVRGRELARLERLPVEPPEEGVAADALRAAQRAAQPLRRVELEQAGEHGLRVLGQQPEVLVRVRVSVRVRVRIRVKVRVSL